MNYITAYEAAKAIRIIDTYELIERAEKKEIEGVRFSPTLWKFKKKDIWKLKNKIMKERGLSNEF
jgi:hypothetical protein